MVIGCAQRAENENKHSWSFKILNHSMKINNGKFNCDFPSAFGCDIGEHTRGAIAFYKTKQHPFQTVRYFDHTHTNEWEILENVILYCVFSLLLFICVRSFFNQNIYHFQTTFLPAAQWLGLKEVWFLFLPFFKLLLF